MLEAVCPGARAFRHFAVSWAVALNLVFRVFDLVLEAIPRQSPIFESQQGFCGCWLGCASNFRKS
jgi:hypothetical protein